jgi:hypothetical protein
MAHETINQLSAEAGVTLIVFIGKAANHAPHFCSRRR